MYHSFKELQFLPVIGQVHSKTVLYCHTTA